MNVYVTDSNVVADLEATLFELFQASPFSALLFITNSGVNTMNYRFQSSPDGVTYTDMDVFGTDLNNTLISGQSKPISISAVNPRIRMVGNATGGGYLDFSVSRIVIRASGGALPILSL